MIERIRFAFTCIVAASLASCAYLPDGSTTQSERLHEDWAIFFFAGLIVAAIVVTLIVLPLILWHRRAGDADRPPQFAQNIPLEIACTVVPLAVVAFLFYASFTDENAVEALDARPAVTIEVSGFDWSWRFQYQGSPVEIVGTPEHPPELVLPVGETAQIDLTSADVNHAFWVPSFLFKRDAIPGMVNRFDLRPDKIGVYRGECAEYCGIGHTTMDFTVRVVDDPAFDRWMRAKSR